MLKKNAQFLESLFFISDLLILSLAWILSYFLRFQTTLIKPPLLGTPPFVHYIEYLFPLWGIWALVSKEVKLYRPRRFERYSKESLDLAKCLTLTFFMLIAIIYFFKSFEFSRLAFLYFWVISFLGFALYRLGLRKALRTFRKRGYNRRYGIIAGAGELGQKLLEKLQLYPDMGIQILCFLSHKAEEVGKRVRGIPILGVCEEINKILSEYKVDILFIALSIDEYGSLSNLIENLKGQLLDVKVVPGVCEFITLRGGADELDGLPLVSLRNSPLYGWNKVFKRTFDLILGTLILIILSPIMFVISLLVKGTSEGPVFYRQDRIGMDERPFQMLKFRTMRKDAEKETGPVWARKSDPRRTRVGAFLRKTSLDELPQLLNVLKGEMSLVGPRPERPNFIKEFTNKIPLYIFRHKIKAGMTGWAQVNGWRGNTSLEKRIEHDLYYIQNWSIAFDLRILFITLWRGFFSKSAY